jgi:hypothetical protein
MAILETANDILIDLDGELVFVQDTAIYGRDTTDTTEIGATVIFNNSDLGVPDIDKLINLIDVDYIGTFSIQFDLDGSTVHTANFPTKASRGTVYQDFPLAKRKAFQKLKMTINASDKTTKIYSIEIDFTILKRRRYN